jgi:hypothetical protein
MLDRPRGLKTTFRAGLAAAFAAGLLVAIQCLAAQDARFFRIGTGPTEGTYFQVGTLIGSIISSPPGARECERGGSCGVTGLIAINTTTAGSVANIEAIRTRQLESGLAQADVAYWAFHGTGPYRDNGAVTNLRAIAHLYPESVHVVVRANSGIEEIDQLRGKVVSLGERASGSAVTATIVLDSYGVEGKDFQARHLRTAEAADALRAGTIDAFIHVAGAPDPVVKELAEAVDIRLLPVGGEEVRSLRQSYPFLTVTTIGHDLYRGVATTATLSIATLWLVGAEVDESIVYGLTRALFHPNNRRALDASQPFGRYIRPQTALEGLTLQLHSGAALYYFESGLLR